MRKEQESRPGLLGTLLTTCLIAFLAKNMWDLYTPSVETDGSQRFSIIERRIVWQVAVGSEDSIIKITPWIDDNQIGQKSLGSLRIVGRLTVDESPNIPDYINARSAVK